MSIVVDKLRSRLHDCGTPRNCAGRQPGESMKHFDYAAEAAQTKSPAYHGDKVPLSYFTEAVSEVITALQRLDGIKKALFYGRDLPVTNLTGEHVNDCHGLPMWLAADNMEEQAAIDTLHAMLGLATEAGELLEALDKALTEHNGFDLTNLAEEGGDSLWYMAILFNAIGTTFDAEKRRNIAKLRARFPHKFTEYDANNRDLLGERLVLEQTVTERVGDAEVTVSKKVYK